MAQRKGPYRQPARTMTPLAEFVDFRARQESAAAALRGEIATIKNRVDRVEAATAPARHDPVKRFVGVAGLVLTIVFALIAISAKVGDYAQKTEVISLVVDSRVRVEESRDRDLKRLQLILREDIARLEKQISEIKTKLDARVMPKKRWRRR